MEPESLGLMGTAAPIIAMLFVFYFLLYRPQKKEQQRRLSMIENVAVGDHIVTVGGLYGEVTGLEEKTMRLKIADRVEIKIARAAVNANLTQDENARF